MARSAILAVAIGCAASTAAPTYTWDTSFAPLQGTAADQVTAVAVVNGAAGKQVIIAQRGKALPFMLLYNYSGHLESSWGTSAVLTSPHGMQPAFNGNIDVLWVTDIEGYTVKAFSGSSGVLLGVLGTQGKAGNGTGANVQFSAPADIAIDEAGNVYVSDGDGGSNNRVVAMSPGSGYATVFAVGGLGDGPGQFSSPHSLAWDSINTVVWVADRGNNRLQVLAGVGHTTAAPGTVMGMWNTTSCMNGQPWGVRVDVTRGVMFIADGLNGLMFVVELPTSLGPAWPACNLLQTVEVCPASSSQAGCKPHELALDTVTGEVYLANVATDYVPANVSQAVQRFVPT